MKYFKQINIKILIKWAQENKTATILLFTGFLLFILSFNFEHQRLERFYSLFLSANFFFLSLGLSGLLFPSIHYTLKAKWSDKLITFWLQTSNSLPVLIFSFLLLFTGYQILFPPNRMNAGEHALPLSYHNIYLQAARTIIIFLLILYFYFRFKDLVVKNKTNEGGKRKISILFLITFFITFSIIINDWMPGKFPAWHNSIYALYQITGLMSGGLAFVIIMLYFHGQQGKETLHKVSDKIGSYLLAVISFWFYFGFSQLLIIWYAGIPYETKLFIFITNGAGIILFILNFILNFVVPLLVLIVKDLRCNTRMLLTVSLVIIAGRWLDYFLFAAIPVTRGIIHFGMMETASIILTIGFLNLFLKQKSE